jgi:hypothetical protein
MQLDVIAELSDYKFNFYLLAQTQGEAIPCWYN